MSIFKDCDIRGIYGENFSDEDIKEIAFAIKEGLLTEKEVVVCGDVRLTTPKVKNVIIEELIAEGIDVIDIGIAPTPVFYYALKHLKKKNGLMVTASHNPSEYNGLKLAIGDKPLIAEDIKKIQNLITKRSFKKAKEIKGKLKHYTGITEDYINFIVQRFQNIKIKHKVVIDTGNGTATLTAANIFKKLGFTVVELFGNVDGSFPNRPPNPALADNLKELSLLVKKEKADFGIGFDGDGDRVAFVDENGCYIDNDFIMAVIAIDFCQKTKNAAIVYDAKCSFLVPEMVKKYGGKAFMAKAGHTYSKLAAIENNAEFAGEISGHFYFSEIGFDDPNFAVLKICEILERKKYEKISFLKENLPHYVSTEDIRVKYEDDDKELIIKQMQKCFKDGNINTVDGLRVDWKEGWGLIRSSVTEPMFTLRFEATDKKKLQEIILKFVEIMPSKLCDIVKKEREIIKYALF